jgi:hypothetical protein
MLSKETIAVLGVVAIIWALWIAYFLHWKQAVDVKTFPVTLRSSFQSKLVEENQGVNTLNVANYMDTNWRYFKNIDGRTIRALWNLSLNGYVVIYTWNEVTDGTTFASDPLDLREGQIAVGFITNNKDVENCSNKGDWSNYLYLTGGSIKANKSDDAPICRWYDDTVKQFIFVWKSNDLKKFWESYLDKRGDVKWVSFQTLSGLVLPIK